MREQHVLYLYTRLEGKKSWTRARVAPFQQQPVLHEIRASICFSFRRRSSSVRNILSQDDVWWERTADASPRDLFLGGTTFPAGQARSTSSAHLPLLFPLISEELAKEQSLRNPWERWRDPGWVYTLIRPSQWLAPTRLNVSCLSVYIHSYIKLIIPKDFSRICYYLCNSITWLKIDWQIWNENVLTWRNGAGDVATMSKKKRFRHLY